jgi:hypothetical protein
MNNEESNPKLPQRHLHQQFTIVKAHPQHWLAFGEGHVVPLRILKPLPDVSASLST